MVFLGEVTHGGFQLWCSVCHTTMDTIPHREVLPFMLYTLQNDPIGPICMECDGIRADSVPEALQGNFKVAYDGKTTYMLV